MKKHIIFNLAVGLAAMVLTGCKSTSSNGTTNSTVSNYSMQDYAVAETMAVSGENGMGMSVEQYEEEKSEEVRTNQTATNRKLIKTVSMDVETEEFDHLISQLQTRIGGLGGYIESSSTNNSSYYVNNGRHANYVIRIPSDRLDELVGNVTEIANVTWKEESVQDITLRYIDVESHKIALQTEQERLLVLMEKAETVEDLITIESRLSEIRYQIQSYESTLRTFDNQVDYSTLHLGISEVKKLTPQEEPGILERIRDGFTENLINVGTGAMDFFVGVVVAIPYLIVWGVVIWIVCWIYRKLPKNRKQKKAFWKRKKVGISEEAGSVNIDNDYSRKDGDEEKK